MISGVCLSHAVLISELVSFAALSSDDILWTTSSLYWISGLSSLLLSTFYGATRIITAESISCEKYLSIMEKYKATFVLFGCSRIGPTLKCEAIDRTNFEHVRVLVLGGANIPSYIIEKFDSLLPNGHAHNAYGFTELGGIFTLDYQNFSGFNTNGHLFSGYTFKIVDDNGQRLGVKEDGEICVKHLFKFLGYYRDEALTGQVVDDEGFFHSGDIGHFNENGALCVVGRKKDLIGYPCYISPHEIEQVLIKRPEIQTVCVVGVSNRVGYEIPAALIVRTEHSKLTEQDVWKAVAGEFTFLKLMNQQMDLIQNY